MKKYKTMINKEWQYLSPAKEYVIDLLRNNKHYISYRNLEYILKDQSKKEIKVLNSKTIRSLIYLNWLIRRGGKYILHPVLDRLLP